MSDVLHHFVDVRRELTSRDVKESCISGKCLLGASLLSRLKTLARQGVASEIAVVDGKEKEVREIEVEDGNEVEASVKLYPQELPSVEDKEQRAHYFETMDDLVERFRSEAPRTEYYVHGDVRSFSSNAERHPQIASYEKIVRLADLLASLAVFKDSHFGAQTLYFFQDSKVEVPIKYAGDDISELTDFDQLKLELSREGEKDTRREVFVNTLVDELKGIASDKRFAHILREFDSISHKYRQGHQRYLQNFSYEELKSSFIKDRAAYIDRLNEVVSEVQNKLITVPLGLLVVGGQLEAQTPYSGVNFVIAFGAIVLTVMLHLLINNQKNLLGDIREEIEKLKKDYREGKTDPPEIVQKGFKKLKGTRERQAAVLDLFSGFVWMFLVTTLALWAHYLIKHAEPAYTPVVPLIGWAVLAGLIGYWFRLDQTTKVLWKKVA